jgi:glutamyl-tRNA reductase
VRERFAYAAPAVTPALTRLRAEQAQGEATEVALLSTCNRTELYAADKGDPRVLAGRLRDFLLLDRQVPAEGVEFYLHHDRAAAEHLFRVAAGLDSLVLGETEILGQLKQAYEWALAGGFTGKLLNRAFQRAFNVAKKVRTETNIQRGNTSVASVAVELAERIFDRLDHREVLVLGAGDTSEKTARALLSRGARSVLVSNRTHERAEQLAAELNGRAIRFAEWEHEFARIDIVISATGAPHVILTRERLAELHRRRGARPLLLIDLAVPRDIDSDCEQLDDVYLYNVDHLQAVADEATRLRRFERERCEQIVRCQAVELMQVRGFSGDDSPTTRTVS